MARTPRVRKGRPLNLPTGLEVSYATELRKMVRSMAEEVSREVAGLYRDTAGVAQDAAGPSGPMRKLFARLLRKYTAMFERHAERLAKQMVLQAEKESDTRFRSSLKELSGGYQLKTSAVTPAVKKEVTARISENVDLIKSIPEQYLEKTKAKVMESVTKGDGLQTIVQHLQDEHGIAMRRAKNIAEDQTRKAYNNINSERMQAAGIEYFEWMHSSGGEHPRELHITPWPDGLNGGIFSFKKLPVIDERTGERGIPGQAINCKCRMRPVLRPPKEDIAK